MVAIQVRKGYKEQLNCPLHPCLKWDYLDAVPVRILNIRDDYLANLEIWILFLLLQIFFLHKQSYSRVRVGHRLIIPRLTKLFVFPEN